MTYCVAVKLDSGLVFASDSRSNAGVDNVLTVRKQAVFEQPGERLVVLQWSGNLAVTQAVLEKLARWSRPGSGQPGLLDAESVDAAAALVGKALREVHHRDGSHLMNSGVDAGANFIVGGQVAGAPARLFHVNPGGHHIECSPDLPFVLIGEIKYGRAILERVIGPGLRLLDAVKCVLVSFDYTIRNNISVGLPIDLACAETGALRLTLNRRIQEGDPYFHMIHSDWGERLRRALSDWPDPDWGNLQRGAATGSAPQ